MKCHLCDDKAVCIFEFSRGCYCDNATYQPLCLHHSFKSGPAKDGTMCLIKDLTEDKEFTKLWKKREETKPIGLSDEILLCNDDPPFPIGYPKIKKGI